MATSGQMMSFQVKSKFMYGGGAESRYRQGHGDTNEQREFVGAVQPRRLEILLRQRLKESPHEEGAEPRSPVDTQGSTTPCRVSPQSRSMIMLNMGITSKMPGIMISASDRKKQYLPCQESDSGRKRNRPRPDMIERQKPAVGME